MRATIFGLMVNEVSVRITLVVDDFAISLAILIESMPHIQMIADALTR